MRQVRHPGPVTAERVTSVACRAERHLLSLLPGRSINQAAAEAFANTGLPSGYIRLRNATASSMRYVIPDLATDGRHVAWYSDIFSPEGEMMIEDAGLVVGKRNGAAFLHCHGLWRARGGPRRMGHLLPLETELAELVEVEAWAISGAAFETADDRETNFHLFRPVSQQPGRVFYRPAVACTVRPNQDISLAIEEVCRRHDISEASVHGIGSLIGADFEGGGTVDFHATEVLIRTGKVRGGQCSLSVALVGMDGAVCEGRLRRGANPVSITFELLIVAD